MKKLIIVAIFIMLAVPLMGQRVERLMQAGDEHFQKEEYTKAIEMYDKILSRDRDQEIRQEVSFKLAESHRNLLNYAEAWKWYTLALNVGHQDPVIYLYLSEMGLGLEDFENSIRYARKYLEQNPEDPMGEKILESALFSKENYYLESLIEVSNEQGLNTDDQEWGVGFFNHIPVFVNDPAKRENQFDTEISLRYNNIIYWAMPSRIPREKIVFSSTKDETGRLDSRTGTGYSNIYQATYNRSQGQWESPSMLQGGINSDFYEGFLSFDQNTNTAYYMNCGGYQGTRASCDIYTASYDPATDQWGDPVLFDLNSDAFNIGYPSIAEDGNTMFFASDMPGGFGGYDLYKIERDPATSQWGEPVNLGAVVNTPYNDAYPYIAGNILYFSSFGHPGFGGFDIFYTEIDAQGNYSQPENMSAPINSSADDFSFIINNEYTRGYFSSNRPGGSGKDDIYSFRVTPETFVLSGKVIDSNTQQPVADAEFLILDDDQQELQISVDSLGNFHTGELSALNDYQINVMHPEYQPYQEYFTVSDKLIASRFLVVDALEKDIRLAPKDSLAEQHQSEITEADTGTEKIIPLGSDIQRQQDGLPVIYFDYGSYRLKEKEKQKADQVVEFLNEITDVGFVIHGHTDERSGYLFNLYLSQQRAQAIINYLVSKGIDKNRLFPFGHGKMDLAVVNAQTDEEHQLNRRGTFEIYEADQFSRFLDQAPQHSFRYLNSPQKEAHLPQDIEFMVQFAASRKPLHPSNYNPIMKVFAGHDIIYYYDKDRFHHYAVGSFPDLDSAVEMHRKMRQQGFDTYIVAFHKGQRINVAEANRMLKNR
ncbi:MAG: OmpA family protein [Bacteroidales bacterium]